MSKTVSKYMCRNPYSFNVAMSIKDFIKKIKEFNSTHAIVVNNEGVAIGVISQKDILNYLLLMVKEGGGDKYSALELKNTSIGELMTKTPIMVKEKDTMEYALNLLNKNKFHCLPVVDGENKPVGIITFFDLLKGFVNLMHPTVLGFNPKNQFRTATWKSFSSFPRYNKLHG